MPPAWIHAHRARHVGYVLLRGAHTLASLAKAVAVSPHAGGRGAAALNRSMSLAELLASLPAAERVGALRRQVLEWAGPQRVLCRDDADVATHLVLPERGDGLGGTFDRQGRVICSPFAFAAGETVTVFAFSRPRWARTIDPFPQHAMLLFYYVPEPSSPPTEGEAAEPEEPVRAVTVEDTYQVIDLDQSQPGARWHRCRVAANPILTDLLKAFGISSSSHGRTCEPLRPE